MTATRAPRGSRARRERKTSQLAVGLLLVTMALIVVGLVMVLSSSFVQAARTHGSSWYYFNRQLVWAGLGGIAMTVAMRFDYRRLQPLARPLLAVTGALLLLVLIPSVGIVAGGSRRWLGAGAFRMQPSEMAKLAVILFAADLLVRRADAMDDWRATARPVLLVAGGFGILVLKQPDLGTTLLLGGISLAILHVAGTRLRVMATLVTLAAALTFVAARIEPYRWRRIVAFLDPWADPGNSGYQAAQGLVALGSGQITGAGLGASRAKWGFLPAAHTDFIFAIIGEELGLIGTLSVVALFAAFAVLLIRAALRAPDRFGLLLVTGIAAWLVGQAVVNISAVVGLLPITGVPLPFVSAGGSSLVIAMAATGIALNVARQGRPPPAKRQPAR